MYVLAVLWRLVTFRDDSYPYGTTRYPWPAAVQPRAKSCCFFWNKLRQGSVNQRDLWNFLTCIAAYFKNGLELQNYGYSLQSCVVNHYDRFCFLRTVRTCYDRIVFQCRLHSNCKISRCWRTALSGRTQISPKNLHPAVGNVFQFHQYYPMFALRTEMWGR